MTLNLIHLDTLCKVLQQAYTNITERKQKAN